MPRKPKNRVGEIYGKLTVIRLSSRRTTAGNAYWWCLCSCGKEREVSSDSLSKNSRKKKSVTQCKKCAQESTLKGLYKKIDHQEKIRRATATKTRSLLEGKVPKDWLKLPLTDSHARELGKKHFFRGIKCLKGHLSPYRINGGCLECASQQQKPKHS